MKFIHAVFPNKPTADEALQAVLDEHVPPRDVWVALNEGTEVTVQRPARRTGLAMNVAVAGSIGLLAGIIVGALMPTGLIGSEEATTIQLGALGAFIGLVLGTLRGVGRWRHEVRIERPEIARAGVLMAVGVPTTRLQRLSELLRAKGGRHLRIKDRPVLPNTDEWSMARS